MLSADGGGFLNLDDGKYRSFCESMPDAFAYCQIVTDDGGQPVDFIYLHVNPAYETTMNIKMKDIIGKKVSEVFPDVQESGFDWIETFAQVTASGKGMTFEQLYRPSKRWFQVTVFSNEPGFFAVIFRDITLNKLNEESLLKSWEKQIMERRQAEEALQESEERYFSLVSNLPVGIHRTSPGDKGRFILANPTSVALLGYESEQELKEIDVCDLYINPADRKAFSDLLIEQGVINQEFQLKRKDGSIMWCFESARAVCGDDGKVMYFDCIIQDIADRKRAEEALHYQYQYEKLMAEREREKQYMQLVEMSPTAIFVFEDGKITISNRAAAQMLGAGSPDDLVDRSIEEFLHPGVQSAFADMVDKALTEEEPYVESRLMRKDGQPIDVVISASYLMDHGIPVIRTTVWDISEYKRKEQELINTAKLESLAILAGGIAHDFNNILTVVLGNLSLAKAYRNNAEKVLSKLNEIEEAALQTKDLANQLLTFSRGGSPVKSSVSIAEILEKSVLLAKSGANVRCELNFARNLYPVQVDEGQMRQVFNNLTINAVQAMTDGGTIRVKAENAVLSPEQSREIGLREGHYVKITFADEGIGIHEDNITRIYDPFFTTKTNGSGLGLTTVKSIIQKHDGVIAVNSKPGIGTTVVFYLPAPNSNQEVDTAGSLQNGKVLLMDDEENIRKVASEMLNILGFEVDTAAEGSVALALYNRARELDTPYNAVILDLTVPGGMGGKEAVTKLLEMDPAVRVIVSSGYCNDPVLANYQEYGFVDKLAKPYKVEDMEKVLHKVLNR
jgi:two-component system, cell cycle sensor histidine kinase and response regulator CckA